MSLLEIDENHARYQIRAFKPGSIQINNEIFTKSLIITPSELITDWRPQTAQQLSEQDFSRITSLDIDLLLIGTGSHLIFLAPELYASLINKGIGVEVMDTRAACYTYNALSAEGRKVAAALMLE